jgi:hypothetical protein
MSVFQLKNVNYLDNNIIYCAMPLVLLIKDYNGDLAFPKNAPTINIAMIFFLGRGGGVVRKTFFEERFWIGEKACSKVSSLIPKFYHLLACVTVKRNSSLSSS